MYHQVLKIMTEQLTLLTGSSYRNFIQAVHSPFSRQIYKDALKHFMSFRKVESCDQLLEGDVQSYLIDYVIYLREERKVVANTIKVNLAALRKFYDTNDIDKIKWKKVKMYVGKTRSNGKRDRPYTHYEISKMLEKADQRGKVAILLMCSSGMRVGALSTLKVRNLQKIDKYNLYRITVYEGDDEEYDTFCTPECAAVIDSYLEYRERNGERPIKEDAPLIREEFDINDEIKAARPKLLGQQAFRRMIRRIGYDSGIMEKRAAVESKRGQRRLVKETHGFRKFFQTTAITSGMNPLFSELLMGHTSGGLALESYVRPTENDLLEGNDKMTGYIGVIDVLTINEEHRLKQKVKELTIKADKVDELQADFAALKQKLGI